MNSRCIICFFSAVLMPFISLATGFASSLTCSNPASIVFVPRGQVIPGFPAGLMLDITDTVSDSYGVCSPYTSSSLAPVPPSGYYQSYTVEQSTSQSTNSWYNAYHQFLPTAGWTIYGEVTSLLPQQFSIGAQNGWAQLEVNAIAVGTGSVLTVSYIGIDQPQPMGLSAVSGNGQVTLHWGHAQVIPSTYQVYIYQVNGASGSTLLGVLTVPGSNTPATTETISTIPVPGGSALSNGQLYQFAVTAIGLQGESAPVSIYAQPGAFVAPSHPPNPIVFLHGINADASAWQSTANYLTQTLHWTCGGTLSYIPSISFSPLTNAPGLASTCSPFQTNGDFFTVNFGNNLANYSDGRAIFHQGDEVGGVLDFLPSSRKFSIVGWSMGGLAARAYIQETSPGTAPNRISDLITLGTPHKGVDLSFLRSPITSYFAQLAGLENVLDSQGATAMDGGCVANGDSTDYVNQLSPFLYQIDIASGLPAGIRYTTVSGVPLSGIHSDECNTPLVYIVPPQIQTDWVVPVTSSTFTGTAPNVPLWYSFNRDDNHLDLPDDVTAILCALDHSCAMLSVFSPVDIQVKAPNGQTISSTLTTMPGAEYRNITEANGHETASVLIPFPQGGQYTVTATPKPGASPTDTFTINLTQNGTTTTIANAMQIQSIPPKGFQTHINALPTANAGPDQRVQCEGRGGGWVVLDGTRSRDANGLRLSYEWTDAEGNIIGKTPVIRVLAPLGITAYSLAVGDSTGLSSISETSVTVLDTRPPILWLGVSPKVLIPADNNLVPISVEVAARDHCDCDAKASIELVSIVSNDPTEDRNDIQGAVYGTDDRTFLLRARLTSEREMRVYTITYRATDAAGNSSTAAVTVPVLPGLH